MAGSTASRGRFASLTDKEFDELLKSKDSDNTIRATKNAVAIFRAYLKEKDLPEKFEELTKASLDETLERFYAELRKTDGDYYKTASMNQIRNGINRHLKSEFGSYIDIIKETEFTASNAAFKASLVQLKKLGKGDITHHSPIEEEDIETLYEYFDQVQDTPAGLQHKVFFEIMLYICRRGRENLRLLKKDYFAVEIDANGREYVVQTTDELTKKCRDTKGSRVDAGRMYATNTVKCPVASFKCYVSKLNPECDAFFQTPKPEKPKLADSPWYKRSPIGQSTLGNFMRVLSLKGRLSKQYTNHCIRSTCITILDEEGFASRDICKVSGHANEGSIATYVGRVKDARKKDMSDALSKSI